MSTKYFIPQIVNINEIQVPSTPFDYNNGQPLYLGDVFEVKCTDESETEVMLAELINGQYVATSRRTDDETPLWVYQECDITVLGSSVSNPELLELLT